MQITRDDVKREGSKLDVVLIHVEPPVIVPAMLRINAYTLTQHQEHLRFALKQPPLTDAEIELLYGSTLTRGQR